MPFGNEIAGFVQGLQIGTQMQNQFSQMRERRATTDYYTQLTADQFSPENKLSRARQLRAGADQAEAQAQRAQIETGEYGSDYYTQLRRGNAQSEADTQRANADMLKLKADEEKAAWFEYNTPRAAAMRQEAEDLAQQGLRDDAMTKVLTLNDLATTQWQAMRSRTAADIKKWQVNHPDKEVPAYLQTRMNEPPPDYTHMFESRFGFGAGPPTMGPTAAPAQAVPAAPRAGRGQLNDSQKAAVNDAANELGVSPADLLAVVSYETGGSMNPGIVGGAGNNYRGLIQFGPNERQQYGYRDGMSFEDQMRGPVVAYLKGRGLPRGADLAQIYSVINAGSLGPNGQPRWNAADGRNNIRGHVLDIANNHLPGAEAQMGAAGASTQAVADQQAVPASPQYSVAAANPSAGLGRSGEPATTGSIAAPTTYHQDVANMNRMGTEAAFEDAGLLPAPAVMSQDMVAGARSLYNGDGAADPQAMADWRDYNRQLDDPSGTVGHDDVLNALAMVQWAQEYAPDKAKDFAKELVKLAQLDHAKYLSIAKVAAQRGDTSNARKMAIRAYAGLPNNVDMSIDDNPDGSMTLSFTRGDGKKVHQQVVDTPQLLAGILGIRPEDSWRMLNMFADQPQNSRAYTDYLATKNVDNAWTQATGEGPNQWFVGTAPSREPNYNDMTPEETAAVQKEMAESGRGPRKPFDPDAQTRSAEDVHNAWNGNSETQTMSVFDRNPQLTDANIKALETHAGEMQNIAQQMIWNNPNITPDQAVDNVVEMTKVSPNDPDVRPYRARQFEDTGEWQVSLQNGSPILTIDASAFDLLGRIREEAASTQRQANAQTKYDEDMDQLTRDREAQRGRAGITQGGPGEELITNYEDFKRWRLATGSRPGRGAGVQQPVIPPDVENRLRREWELYNLGRGGIGHQ